MPVNGAPKGLEMNSASIEEENYKSFSFISTA